MKFCLSKEDFCYINRALEYYFPVGLARFIPLLNYFIFKNCKYEYSEFEEFEKIAIKELYNLNGKKGIYASNTTLNTKIMYDIHQKLRYQIWLTDHK